jgi:cell division protein FtsX
MFYLKEALKVFRKNIFLSASLSVLTFTLFFSVANFGDLQKVISKHLPQVENEHYFNALVSEKVSISSVKRKIEGLPGVKSVKLLDKTGTKNKVKSVSSTLGLSKKEASSLNEMVSIKIALTSQVSQSSINLIREYLTRLAGKDNILIGAVKKKISNEKIFKSLLVQIKKWPLQSAIGVAFVLWMISFFLLRKEILRVAYIIESFQRKTNVALKISLAQLGVVVGASFTISILFYMPNWYAVIAFFAVISVFPLTLLGKREWIKA